MNVRNGGEKDESWPQRRLQQPTPVATSAVPLVETGREQLVETAREQSPGVVILPSARRERLVGAQPEPYNVPTDARTAAALVSMLARDEQPTRLPAQRGLLLKAKGEKEKREEAGRRDGHEPSRDAPSDSEDELGGVRAVRGRRRRPSSAFQRHRIPRDLPEE